VKVLSQLQPVSDLGNKCGAEFVGNKPARGDRSFGADFCVEVTFRRY
jgi:hypothetical protein